MRRAASRQKRLSLALTSDLVRQLQAAGRLRLFRPMRPQPEVASKAEAARTWRWNGKRWREDDLRAAFPAGEPGAVLWVRERWEAIALEERDSWEPAALRDGRLGIDSSGRKYYLCYEADGDEIEVPWRPASRMPHWASRYEVKLGAVAIQQRDQRWGWQCEVRLVKPK